MKSVILNVIFALGALSAPAFAAGEAKSFELVIRDGKFYPETIEVPAGEKIELMVRNEGPGSEEFESHDLNREKIIAAGKTLRVPLGKLAAGTYKFFGEFHPDTANGKIIAK